MENIFLLIAKNTDENVPSGSNWHKDLLTQMNRKTEQRDEVISEDLQSKLLDYLAFRHFYRHSYSFFLDWDEMKGLVINLIGVKEDFEEEIRDFIERN